MMAFITIRFLDILDIFLVALLLFQLYRLIKGTVAYNIVIGLFLIYLFWLIIKALNMELLGSIMGQFIGVGVLALIIVFHPEIRKFLVYIGSNYNVKRVFSLEQLLRNNKSKNLNKEKIEEIADACMTMSRLKTGALIVIEGTSNLTEQINTGVKLNARISSPLLRNLFFKNSPLHDGAVIIKGSKIAAAGCILPLTQKQLDLKYGLRHRAAIGITEHTDAVVIVVSEETGAVSIVKDGQIKSNVSKEALVAFLEENIQYAPE